MIEKPHIIKVKGKCGIASHRNASHVGAMVICFNLLRLLIFQVPEPHLCHKLHLLSGNYQCGGF